VKQNEERFHFFEPFQQNRAGNTKQIIGIGTKQITQPWIFELDLNNIFVY